MKKILIAIGLLTSVTLNSILAADICQGNICIDSNGNIYIKNSETIYSSLIEGSSGSITTGNIKITTGGVYSGNSISSTGTIQTTSGTISSGSNVSGNVVTNDTITNTPIFSSWNEELDAAINRGYNNEITLYDNITDYKSNNLLLREEAAKLFYKSALVVEYNGDVYNDCNFSDINKVTNELKENINNICTLGGLMKGNKGLFLPNNNLTYAEAITVIARIAGITNTSSSAARRTPYLNYVKSLGILKGTNINESTMETKITRGELIVLLYRLSLKYNTGGFTIDNNTSNTESNISLPSDTNSSNSSVSIGAGVIDTPKFTTALLWMYHSDMTVYWKASDYDPFSITTREQAAKLLSIYNKKFITSSGSINITCNYNDIKDSGLKDYINDACKQGIFKNTTTFNPSNAIIKSEFVTAVINMLNEKPLSGQTLSSKALELELISKADLATFDKPITRYEVALMLSNLHLKSEFINNLKDTSVNYNVISPIDKDTAVYPIGQQKVFIDINSIDSKEFNNGFINLFGKTYKISKKEIINYFPTSYSRYGEIADITNDNEIGSISLAIGQKGGTKALIEGFIAFPDIKEIYSIYPTNQIPYYMITKIK